MFLTTPWRIKIVKYLPSLVLVPFKTSLSECATRQETKSFLEENGLTLRSVSLKNEKSTEFEPFSLM